MRSGHVSVVLLLVLVEVTSKRIDLDPFQELILEQHNDYRREERASNMCLMKWNASLAQEAGRWADRCVFKHEVKSGLGENLAFDTRNWDTDRLLDGLMEGWHDEKRMWSYGSKPCGFACHFTQIVWHSTNTIGCAATRCPSMTGMMTTPIKNAFYLVCFYYPRGNWIGQVAYVPGRACSKCDDGATCSNELCDTSGVSVKQNTAVLPAPPPQSKQPVSRNRNPFTVLRKSSRFETFSHGIGDKRKTVTRGMSFLHQSGPQALRAPQAFTARRNQPLALRSRQLFRSNHRGNQQLEHQGRQLRENQGRQLRVNQGRQLSRNQGRQLRENRARDMYSKTSQKENNKVQQRNKPKRRRSRRCKDRLPSCFKWADRCERNRAMKVICPKSCDACEMVFSMVDGKNKKNGHNNGHSKPEVHAGNNGRQHGNRQIKSNSRQEKSHHQQHHRQRQRHHQPQSNRQHQRQHHQRQTHTQHQQHQTRQSHTQANNRHHLKHKPSTHQQQNRALPQRDDPHCSDSTAFAKRCIYWKKTGFCKGNYMMRTMYCKKSCGNC